MSKSTESYEDRLPDGWGFWRHDSKKGEIIHIKPECEESKKLAGLVQREALNVLAGKDRADTRKYQGERKPDSCPIWRR